MPGRLIAPGSNNYYYARLDLFNDGTSRLSIFLTSILHAYCYLIQYSNTVNYSHQRQICHKNLTEFSYRILIILLIRQLNVTKNEILA